MARKTTKLKPAPQSSATPDRPNIPDPAPPPAEASRPASPGGGGAPPKRKRGRPSKADVAAREAEARRATELSPEAVFPVTKALLFMLGAAIKGDQATEQETKMVNVSMTAVMNRYSVEFAHMEIVNLSISLVVVGAQMRRRQREKNIEEAPKRETPGNSGHHGTKGERQDRADSSVLGLRAP